MSTTALRDILGGPALRVLGAWVLVSVVLHLAWEIAQLPFFTLWHAESPAFIAWAWERGFPAMRARCDDGMRARTARGPFDPPDPAQFAGKAPVRTRALPNPGTVHYRTTPANGEIAMPTIHPLKISDADPVIAATLNAVRAKLGGVPNLLAGLAG